MDALPPHERLVLENDLRSLRTSIHQGVNPKRVVQADTIWAIWEGFFAELRIDPGLSTARDPLPYLLLFGERFHDGRLAPAGNPVSARHAEDAVRHVGQAFSAMGLADPRLNHRSGKTDFRLQRLVLGGILSPVLSPNLATCHTPSQDRNLA